MMTPVAMETLPVTLATEMVAAMAKAAAWRWRWPGRCNPKRFRDDNDNGRLAATVMTMATVQVRTMMVVMM
jgi:hypothetical protein